MIDPAPLIVAAILRDDAFGWLDGLRRAHFPPERNLLPAHLTLFHHLPPSIEMELRLRLSGLVCGHAAPTARATAVMNLGRGTAIRIDSAGLIAIRAELAEAFARLLVPQDASGWRPHVTIQNKVAPEAARDVQRDLGADFRAREIGIAGIAVWRYRGGPWEKVSRHMFRTG